LVNLHEKILEVDRHFDFFFCPCLLDTKKKDVEALPDGALAITFFNGAIRTAENREMARLMRAKSQLLIAFGACACMGSIPALSNLHSREAHLRTNYLDSPSLDNPAGTLPQLRTATPEGELFIQMLGGRGIHPTAGLPGGWSKSVSEERVEIEAAARKNIDFALFSLEVFEKVVWQNPQYRELLESDVYCHRTYSMGTVDESNRLNLYDGQIRIVDPDGLEFARYPASQYLDHIAEHVEPWTYLKFPFLKKIGWKGLEDGAASGVYAATPLTRLNVSAGLATPLAQEQFEKFYAAFGGSGPVHYRLATHWARLIEMLYAAERMLELATDPEITSPDVRTIPQRIAGTEGRLRRGPPRHAHPSLPGRRKRPVDESQPDRRHHQQPCRHRHVH
jgi:hypothetical protein